jgi:hypothetical protein
MSSRREAIQALVGEMFSPEGEALVQRVFPSESPEDLAAGMEIGRRHAASLVAALLESDLTEETARGLKDGLGHLQALLRVIGTDGFKARYADHLKCMGIE